MQTGGVEKISTSWRQSARVHKRTDSKNTELLSHQVCVIEMHQSFQIALARFVQEVAQASTVPRLEYQSVSWIRKGVPVQCCVWEVDKEAAVRMPNGTKFPQSKYKPKSIIYFPSIVFLASATPLTL